MRYQRKSSIAYIFRNFWHLAPIGLIAAVLMGFFCNNSVEVSFVEGFMHGSLNDENVLRDVLNAVSVLRFREMWWGVILAVLTFVFTESMLTIKVARHMRTGEMVAFPVKRAFSVFPTMLLFVLCVCALVECLNLVIAGVAFLLRAAGTLTVVIVTVSLVYVVRILAMAVVGTLLFAFPIMYMENYSFNLALSYSVRLVSERKGFLWAMALIYPLCRLALTAICGLIGLKIVTYAVFSLFYLFCIVFVPCVTFKLYYDTVGGERRDISKVMFG